MINFLYNIIIFQNKTLAYYIIFSRRYYFRKCECLHIRVYK